MVYKLRITRWLPTSLNRLMRGSYHVQAKRKRIDCNMVCGYCIQNRIPRAQGRRRVDLCLTLQGRDKEHDDDNCWKNLLDNLVTAGMLIDDCRQYCQRGEVTYERGVERGTLITLTDL